ncbi:hypothetical protein RAC77_24760 [Bacillus sp. BR_7]|uniref:hypothetical protein n=1 Tax=Bacillus sp. BR_7 TaxID=3055774 RepID=UPI0035BFCBA6
MVNVKEGSLKKQLDTRIRKYFSNNSNERFDKLFKILHDMGKPLDVLELICKSNKTKNFFHLAKFYQLSDRLLEADFFMKKHLENNKDDEIGWFELQFIAAKRSDIQTSSGVFKQLQRLEVDEINYLRAVLIHYLAFGFSEEVTEICHLLSKHKKLDRNTLIFIYEGLMDTGDASILDILLKYQIGRELVRKANKHDQIAIQSILLSKLHTILVLAGGRKDA